MAGKLLYLKFKKRLCGQTSEIFKCTLSIRATFCYHERGAQIFKGRIIKSLTSKRNPNPRNHTFFLW